MRKNLFGMMAALLATAGAAHAQLPTDSSPATAVIPAQYGGPVIDSPLVYPGTSAMPPVVSDPTQYSGLYPAADSVNQTADMSAPAPVTGAPGTCSQGCTPGCQAACQSWRVHGWLGGDFLLFFTQAQDLPANLVTAGANQVIGGSAGYGLSIGFRVDTGMWLDSEERTGTQAMSSNLFRTYTTVGIGAGNVLHTALGGPPGAGLPVAIGPGGAQFQVWSQFSNNETNSLFRLINSENTKVYALIGPKFIALEEDMSFFTNAIGINFLDDFHTRNLFFGGQLGVYVKECIGPFVADLEAKCSIGSTYNNVFNLGSNSAGFPFQPFTNFANIGFFETNSFSVVPEVDGNLSYQLTPRIMIRAGYSFLYWTNVVRPGNQMTQIPFPVPPPGTVPGTPFALSNFIIHGMNFGAVFKY